MIVMSTREQRATLHRASRPDAVAWRELYERERPHAKFWTDDLGLFHGQDLYCRQTTHLADPSLDMLLRWMERLAAIDAEYTVAIRAAGHAIHDDNQTREAP